MLLADQTNGEFRSIQTRKRDRLSKRSAKHADANQNNKPMQPSRQSIPPPPAQKIVYVNPSEKFYMDRKGTRKSQPTLTVDEDGRGSYEDSNYDDEFDHPDTEYKDDDKDIIKDGLIKKHDELLPSDQQRVSVPKLFTPNKEDSLESDETDEDYDELHLSNSQTEHKNHIQRETTNTLTLTPQSSRQVNTVKSLDTINIRSPEWKHEIIEEMRASMNDCCKDCKSQMLLNLERKLQLIHRHITRELDAHYTEITSNLLATRRTMSDDRSSEHDYVRDYDILSQQRTTPACDRTPSSVSSNKSNRKIVEVELNDNISDNFKKVVFKVSKPSTKTSLLGNAARLNKRQFAGPFSKLKAIHNEAIKQRRQKLKDKTI